MKIIKILTMSFLLLMTTPKGVEVIAQSVNSPNSLPTTDSQTEDDLCQLKIGKIKIVNDTDSIVVVKLYRSYDSSEIYVYWAMDPGQINVSNRDYNNFWAIEGDDMGRRSIAIASNWNNGFFEIKTSQLLRLLGEEKNRFIGKTPDDCEAQREAARGGAAETLAGILVRVRPGVQILERDRDPLALERDGNNLITQGNRRDGLIKLGQAANLYRARNQMNDYQRVRQRIRQLGSGR